MKERPIIFSSPMVRAILAGTKTQTRRVVKWRGLEPGLNLQFSGLSVERSGSNFVLTSPTRDSHAYRSVPQPCPYGQPGDRLWVRESWQYAGWTDDGEPWVRYQADGEKHLIDRGIPDEWEDRLGEEWANLSRTENFSIDNTASDRRWRPSIHMPRWASRITLEVIGVRVERLQDISEADAMAEGCDPYIPGEGIVPRPRFGDDYAYRPNYIEGYRQLWESINGFGSWDANPWVWCVEFKRIGQSLGEGESKNG